MEVGGLGFISTCTRVFFGYVCNFLSPKVGETFFGCSV